MTSSRSRDEQRAREHELLGILISSRREAASGAMSSPDAAAARDELVALNLGYVRHLARGFAGAPQEDLVQAGTIGLLTAIDAYDPSFGAELATFATKHILGEMRQLASSQAWSLRVPRRVQELAIAVQRATGELTAQLGRAPTVGELSEHLQVTPDSILDAMEATSARRAASIDDADDAPGPGAIDPGFDRVEDRQTVLALLEQLPEREREIVLLTYVDRCSQAQIAERLGISQMHVSRLHRRAMNTMRGALER